MWNQVSKQLGATSWCDCRSMLIDITVETVLRTSVGGWVCTATSHSNTFRCPRHEHIHTPKAVGCMQTGCFSLVILDSPEMKRSWGLHRILNPMLQQCWWQNPCVDNYCESMLQSSRQTFVLANWIVYLQKGQRSLYCPTLPGCGYVVAQQQWAESSFTEILTEQAGFAFQSQQRIAQGLCQCAAQAWQ